MKLETDGQPFNLNLTLDAGQAFRWQKDKKTGCRSGVICGQLIHISQISDRELEFKCAPGPDNAVAEMLRSYFRLDSSYNEMRHSISRDSQMTGLTEQHKGLRLMRQEPWECLISYICSATNSVQRISESMENLSKKWGKELRLGDCVRHTFPTPADLAAADEDELNALIKGIPTLGFRVKSASQMVCDSTLNLTALAENPSCSEVVKELKDLNGVGDKIANCVALFSLDKTDAFPVDRHIARGLIQMGFSGSQKQAQDYFGKYAGYAGQLIFHHTRKGES